MFVLTYIHTQVYSVRDIPYMNQYIRVIVIVLVHAMDGQCRREGESDQRS